MKPPFVRIIRPRFRFLTGHITVGGSICLQVLTVSGWSPSNDIEVYFINSLCICYAVGSAITWCCAVLLAISEN